MPPQLLVPGLPMGLRWYLVRTEGTLSSWCAAARSSRVMPRQKAVADNSPYRRAFEAGEGI